MIKVGTTSCEKHGSNGQNSMGRIWSDMIRYAGAETIFAPVMEREMQHFCEYPVNVLCTFVESITSGAETPWRSYHLNLFTVQERLQKQTRAQPCLMPAWCGLMSSSSWLQLFMTFPLAAACEIWISACLTDIQLPGHRWSTKANSLAKGIITYAKKHIEKESFGSCQFTTTGVLVMMIMKQIEVLYSNLFAKLSTEWKVHDGPNASHFTF